MATARAQEPGDEPGSCDDDAYADSAHGPKRVAIAAFGDLRVKPGIAKRPCLAATYAGRDAAPLPTPLDSLVPRGRGDWEVFQAVHALAFVPFVNDGYVVQGVAHSCEGLAAGVSCDNPRIYLAEYWLAAEGCTVDGDGKRPVCRDGDYSAKRSMIVELDGHSGRMLRCFMLMDESGQTYGHVGGLAHHEGSLYVASNKRVTRYALPPGGSAEGCGLLVTHHNVRGEAETWSVNDGHTDSASTVRLDGQAVLLVGNYLADGSDAAATQAKGYGYCPDGSLGSWQRASGEEPGRLICGEQVIARPVEALSVWLPGRVQGVDVYTAQDGQSYVLAMRGSRRLYRYPLADARAGVRPRAIEQVTVPPGAEDLAVAEGRLWTASESGSRQVELGRRFPWGYFPFVFAVEDPIPWTAAADLTVGKP